MKSVDQFRSDVFDLVVTVCDMPLKIVRSGWVQGRRYI